MNSSCLGSDVNLLKVRDLQVEFVTGGIPVKAVTAVSFDVPRGEIVGLVGESGSGKSVTLRAILGVLDRRYARVRGSVQLEGRELLNLRDSEFRRVRGGQIGFISQDPLLALHPLRRIGKHLHMAVRAHRELSKAARTRIIADALHAVSLPSTAQLLRAYPHHLSGGMAQRVLIATVLALDSRIILADEPTTALDLTVQREILDLLMRLARSESRTVVVVTHDLGVVAQYCSQVNVMRRGAVVESGPVGRVFKQPAHAYTQELLESMPPDPFPDAGPARDATS